MKLFQASLVNDYSLNEWRNVNALLMKVSTRHYVTMFLKKLDEIHAAARQTKDIEELDDFTDDAELEGLFAAYLCPVAEIKIEGDLVLDQIEGWGIPKSSTETARKLWDEASKNLKTSPDPKGQIQEARGALYALFAERDGWGDYLDDHQEKTHRTMWILFVVVVVSLIGAVFMVYYANLFSPLLIFGLLAAGVAGSCASVMSKMPTLEDRLSRKTNSYAGGVWPELLQVLSALS